MTLPSRMAQAPATAPASSAHVSMHAPTAGGAAPAAGRGLLDLPPELLLLIGQRSGLRGRAALAGTSRRLAAVFELPLAQELGALRPSLVAQAALWLGVRRSARLPAPFEQASQLCRLLDFLIGLHAQLGEVLGRPALMPERWELLRLALRTLRGLAQPCALPGSWRTLRLTPIEAAAVARKVRELLAGLPRPLRTLPSPDGGNGAGAPAEIGQALQAACWAVLGNHLAIARGGMEGVGWISFMVPELPGLPPEGAGEGYLPLLARTASCVDPHLWPFFLAVLRLRTGQATAQQRAAMRAPLQRLRPRDTGNVALDQAIDTALARLDDAPANGGSSATWL